MNRRSFLKRLSATTAVAFVPSLLLGTGNDNYKEYQFNPEYHTFDSFFDEEVRYRPHYAAYEVTWHRPVKGGYWYYIFITEDIHSSNYPLIKAIHKDDALFAYRRHLETQG